MDATPDPNWDPTRALESLSLDRALDQSATPQMLAKRLLEENLPVAVMAICHLATHSDTEAIRFNAAKFVVERTMGPAERIMAPEGKHAWDDIYESVTLGAEDYLKNHGN